MSDALEDKRREWLEAARAARARMRPGVLPMEALRTHAGAELLKRMGAGEHATAPICETLDFVMVELEPGRVVFQGNPAFPHYNPLGVVHGGWISTLLDSALGCAVHSALPAGKGYTTLDLKVNFVRSLTAETGPVRAEGKIINVGNRVGTAEARLSDLAGRLYAHATATCLILDING